MLQKNRLITGSRKAANDGRNLRPLVINNGVFKLLYQIRQGGRWGWCREIEARAGAGCPFDEKKSRTVA